MRSETVARIAAALFLCVQLSMLATYPLFEVSEARPGPTVG